MHNSDDIKKMKNSSRVVLNTSIVYTQLIVNTILGLFITRFILQALGEEDYGIYMLVAGVVTFLVVVINETVGSQAHGQEVVGDKLVEQIVLVLVVLVVHGIWIDVVFHEVVDNVVDCNL